MRPIYRAKNDLLTKYVMLDSLIPSDRTIKKEKYEHKREVWDIGVALSH